MEEIIFNVTDFFFLPVFRVRTNLYRRRRFVPFRILHSPRYPPIRLFIRRRTRSSWHDASLINRIIRCAFNVLLKYTYVRSSWSFLVVVLHTECVYDRRTRCLIYPRALSQRAECSQRFSLNDFPNACFKRTLTR